MKNITHSMRRLVAVAVVAGATMASPAITHAAPPVDREKVHSTLYETDHGAYVRILGDPSFGTLKFQFGWTKQTAASDFAVGYWLGVYDITNSRYIWPEEDPLDPEANPIDTGYLGDLPVQWFRNSPPISELPIGQYKVNLFVRKAYDDKTTEFIDETENVAEIELPFTVDYMGG